MALTRGDLKAFLGRDWALMRRVKDISLARTIRVGGLRKALALEQMLIDQGWPRLRREERERNDAEGLMAMRRKLSRG